MRKKYSAAVRDFVTKHPTAIYRAGLVAAGLSGVAMAHAKYRPTTEDYINRYASSHEIAQSAIREHRARFSAPAKASPHAFGPRPSLRVPQ